MKVDAHLRSRLFYHLILGIGGLELPLINVLVLVFDLHTPRQLFQVAALHILDFKPKVAKVGVKRASDAHLFVFFLLIDFPLVLLYLYLKKGYCHCY